ncbi:efflux transporter outer membrane subunit [Snodgrassella communis]|uniref:efflux transporter outer membrane subunit n=1 Tax=Snodgrassella communis TaxID=2946699 RepID=UPI002869EDA4|nr:efflux transporter outer membrane subunit [Snodgrassella communis]WMY90914.1 efflux transporter outer membrane subunit [Snodgrassella communis]
MKTPLVKLLALTALSISVNGCIPRIPAIPATARVETPAQWHEHYPQTIQNIDAQWWTQLNDPVLNQLINEALINNVDIALAQVRIQEALALEHASRASLLPSINASGGTTRQKSLNAFGVASITRVEQPTFQAAYELDIFGKNRNTFQASRLSRQATEMAAAATRISVITTTVKSYITLCALDEKLNLLQKTLNARQRELRIAESKANVGYTSQLELNQAQAEYAATLQQIPVIQSSISQQEHALSILIGSDSHIIERGLSLSQLHAPAIPAMLPSELMKNRPDIVQSSLLLAASDANLASAQAEFFPSVKISAIFGRVFSTAPIQEPVNIWSIGGSVLAPIFEGGKIQANFDLNVAKRNEAAWNYRKTVLTALKEVEDQLSSSYHLQQQEQALEMERAALANALHHATNRYRSGYSPYLDVLDSQRNLLSIESQLIQNKADYLNSQVSLYQALGGGWTMVKNLNIDKP